MRIRDWSSDVCSSDLQAGARANTLIGVFGRADTPDADKRKRAARSPPELPQHLQRAPFQRRARQAARFTRKRRAEFARPVDRRVRDDQRIDLPRDRDARDIRSEEHTSELQYLMRSSYAGFCLKKKNQQIHS